MKKFVRKFRLPAEWLSTERESKISDFYANLHLFFTYLLLALLFVVTVVFGQSYISLIVRHPYIFGAMLVLCLIYSYRKLNIGIAEIQNLNKGIVGEKIVASQLELLKESGFRVFNDLQLGGFNIDFAVVGPGGIYAVEVKNHAHPPTAVLQYRNGVLKLGNQDKTSSIKQVKSAAWTLHDLIFAGTRKNIFVSPVLCYANTKVDLDYTQVKNKENVFVTDDTTINAFFSSLKHKLSAEDGLSISTFLDQYVAANELQTDRRKV